MVVVGEPIVMHQVWTKIMEVELGSVMDQLQSMVDLERRMH